MTDTLTPAAAAPAPAIASLSALDRLMTAFRVMQMHHARVINHEGITRGLNATDVRFVFFLAASDRPVTPKEAGEYLELSTGAMTSLVDRMADRGHIERRPNPGDRRSVLLALTPTGDAIASEIGAVYRTAFSDAVDADAHHALADALEAVGTALHRNSGRGTDR